VALAVYLGVGVGAGGAYYYYLDSSSSSVWKGSLSEAPGAPPSGSEGI